VHIIVETQPDRDRLARAMRRFLRRRLLPWRLCGAVVVLAGLALGPLGEPLEAVFFVGIGLVITFALPWYAVRGAVRQNWRLHGVPTTYELTGDGLRSVNAYNDSLVRWPAVQRVDDAGDQYLLVLGKLHFVPLPIEGLSTDERNLLHDFLRARGLTRA
jgi:hypothetical protein